MEEQVQAPPIAAERNYDGWAVAYVLHQGNISMGYMGRIVSNDGGMVTLVEAFEYMSIQQPARDGLVRTAHGTPLEFTKGLLSVQVRPLSLFILDGLRGADLSLYAQANKEADELRNGLRSGPSVPIGPQKPSGLVTPDGQRLAP